MGRRRRALVTWGGWQPSRIAWSAYYDADHGVYQQAVMTTPSGDGQVFNAWIDRSGNGNHVTRVDDANTGTLVVGALNGKAVLNWVDTGADYLNSNALGAALSGNDVAFDIIMVWAKGYLSASGYSEAPWVIWNSANATPFHAAWTTGVTMSNARRDDSNVIKTANYTLADNLNYHIFEWKFTGTTMSIWQDGVLKANAVDQNVGAMTADCFRIGATGGTGFFLRGGIAAVYVKAAANIADIERINMRRYLSAYYGIAASF